jgi:general secretion pathway protein K
MTVPVPRGEEGAALLTVLMLVAIMAALSAMALERLRLSTHLAANSVALDQARAFAMAGEAVVASRIGDFAGPNIPKTTLQGNWNGRAFRIPIPGGLAVAGIRDGGNCFNLNSVADGLAADQLTTRPTGMAEFVGLMQALAIDPAQGTRIAASLADWIDADTVPNPGGAEDSDYARAARPYRTANTLIADPSELRAVAGVTPEIYAKLRPWVCALPTTDLSPINVNTLLPTQTPLLQMLLPGQIDERRARTAIESRPQGGWDNPTDFWNMQAMTGVTMNSDAGTQLRAKTRWFTLDLDVELAGAQVAETALVDAGHTPVRIVARRWGGDE